MFKHCLFSSFQRQLHAYGFKKIYNREGMVLFRHPSFVKNKFSNLKNIKRKNSRTSAYKQVIEAQKHKSLAESFGSEEKSSVERVWKFMDSKLDPTGYIDVMKVMSYPQEDKDNIPTSYVSQRSQETISSVLDLDNLRNNQQLSKNYELLMSLMISQNASQLQNQIGPEKAILIERLTSLYVNNMKDLFYQKIKPEVQNTC